MGHKTEIEKVSRSIGAEAGAVPAARRDEKGTASKMLRGGIKGNRGRRVGRVQMSYMQKLSPKLDTIHEEEGGDEAEVAPAGPPAKKSLALNLGQEPAAAIAAEGPVTAGAQLYGRPSHSNQESSPGTIISPSHEEVEEVDEDDQDPGDGCGSGLAPPALEPTPESPPGGQDGTKITFVSGGGFSVKNDTQPTGEKPEGIQPADPWRDSIPKATGAPAESPLGGQDAAIKNEQYRKLIFGDRGTLEERGLISITDAVSDSHQADPRDSEGYVTVKKGPKMQAPEIIVRSARHKKQTAVHLATCSASGTFPIKGTLYYKFGTDYILCAEEYKKLPAKEQSAFRARRFAERDYTEATVTTIYPAEAEPQVYGLDRFPGGTTDPDRKQKPVVELRKEQMVMCEYINVNLKSIFGNALTDLVSFNCCNQNRIVTEVTHTGRQQRQRKQLKASCTHHRQRLRKSTRSVRASRAEGHRREVAKATRTVARWQLVWLTVSSEGRRSLTPQHGQHRRQQKQVTQVTQKTISSKPL